VSAPDDSLHWYALRTRSRHEKLVRDRLTKQGVEPLLPTLMRLSQWKDRKKAIEVPLFAGYCFARFSWQERLPILTVPGVVSIVGSGPTPQPIPEEEIRSLKSLMDSALPYDAHPYLREGMAVEVTRGPLEGIRGILLRKEKRYRLVISVHLIKQAAAVEIDAADVAPI
jgi:transcription antitermination factor NusG